MKAHFLFPSSMILPSCMAAVLLLLTLGCANHQSRLNSQRKADSSVYLEIMRSEARLDEMWKPYQPATEQEIADYVDPWEEPYYSNARRYLEMTDFNPKTDDPTEILGEAIARTNPYALGKLDGYLSNDNPNWPKAYQVKKLAVRDNPRIYEIAALYEFVKNKGALRFERRAIERALVQLAIGARSGNLIDAIGLNEFCGRLNKDFSLPWGRARDISEFALTCIDKHHGPEVMFNIQANLLAESGNNYNEVQRRINSRDLLWYRFADSDWIPSDGYHGPLWTIKPHDICP